MRLYQGNLDLSRSDPGAVITRTEGVTASFLRELLRRAALLAAAGAGAEETGAPLRVTDEHLTAVLGELLDSRNQLTRMLLGAAPRGPGQRRATAMGADAVIPARRSPPPDWPLRR